MWKSILNGKGEKLTIPVENIKGGIKHGKFRACELNGPIYPNISEERYCVWLGGKSHKKNKVKTQFNVSAGSFNSKYEQNIYTLRISGMYDFFKDLMVSDKAYTHLACSMRLQGQFRILINGKVIFDDILYFVGYRKWRFWPSFEFDVPSNLIQEGSNQIVVENLTTSFSKKQNILSRKANTINSRITGNTSFVLSNVDIIKNAVKDLSITYCPEIVHTGEKYFIEITALREHKKINIKYPGNILKIESSLTSLKKGSTKIYFNALKPASCVEVQIESMDTKVNARANIGLIVDVPKGFIPKTGHSIGMAQSRNLIKQAKWIRNNHQGNLVGLFHTLARDDPGLPEAFLENVRYCRENDLFFSVAPEDYTTPFAKQALEMAPDNFFSLELWERGVRMIEAQQKNDGDMPGIEKSYLKLFKDDMKKANPYNLSVNTMVMDPSLLMRYHMRGGASFPGVEGMLRHQTLNAACARGVAKAYKIPYWGVVNSFDCQAYGGLMFPEQWKGKIPEFKQIRERLWWLSQYTYYLAGARVIESQSGILHSPMNLHGNHEDDHPQALQKIQRDFYHFTKMHKLLDQPEASIAFIQGKYDSFTGGDYTYDGNIKNIEELRTWKCVRAALPNVSFRRLLTEVDEDPDKRRLYFSDTPYGEIDLLPIEAPCKVMQDYGCLVFCGWNTMDKDNYGKLIKYAKAGGTIFMMLPHLAVNTKRDEELDIINNGDITGLCGVKVINNRKSTTWPKGIYKEPLYKAEFCRESNIPGVKFPVNEQFPVAENNNYISTDVKENLLGNLEVEAPREVIMRDTLTGEPVLIEHQCGKGYVYLMNICGYPLNEPAIKIVETVLEIIFNKIKNEVRLISGKNINFYVYNQGRVNNQCKQIFIIRNDWQQSSGIRKCVFSIFGKEVEIFVPQNRVTIIYANKNIILIPNNAMVLIDRIGAKGNNVEFSIQGKGKAVIKCLPVKSKLIEIYEAKGKARKELKINSTGEIQLHAEGKTIVKIALAKRKGSHCVSSEPD